MADGSLALCPSCGAKLGGREGCQARFHAHGALAWQRPAWAAMHNLLVDAYAMQHPEEFGVSAKSYAQHLIALCVGVEHPGDVKLYWNISKQAPIIGIPTKPELLTARGTITIASVGLVAEDDVHRTQVMSWGRNVWDAYQSQHDIAHSFILKARGLMAERRQAQ